MLDKGEIGFDRRLKLAWLDMTASLVAQRLPPKEIRENLARYLKGQIAESGKRGARSKTITVLCRIWCEDGSNVDPLRREAVHLRQDLREGDSVWLHTGLAMATYPFFLSTMEALGRLQRLQGDVSLQEATRRVCERWGDRERVARSVRHVIQSIRDWGLLETEKVKGVYFPPKPRRQPSIELGIWLVEAVFLGTRREVVPLGEILSSPALFPFDLSVTPDRLRRSGKVRMYRQGLDTDLIATVNA